MYTTTAKRIKKRESASKRLRDEAGKIRKSGWSTDSSRLSLADDYEWAADRIDEETSLMRTKD